MEYMGKQSGLREEKKRKRPVRLKRPRKRFTETGQVKRHSVSHAWGQKSPRVHLREKENKIFLSRSTVFFLYWQIGENNAVSQSRQIISDLSGNQKKNIFCHHFCDHSG